MSSSKGKRDVNKLEVKCSNMSSGCKWGGPLGDLEDHVTKHCGYTEVECLNECPTCIRRRDMNSHMKKCPRRQQTCKYCRELCVYSLVQDHYLKCRLMPVKCTNSGCSAIVVRHKMAEHEEVCRYAEVACKYSHVVGCTVTMRRKDLRVHEGNSKTHLELALVKIESIESELQMMDHSYRLEREKGKALVEDLNIAQDKIKKLESRDKDDQPSSSPVMAMEKSETETKTMENNCTVS